MSLYVAYIELLAGVKRLNDSYLVVLKRIEISSFQMGEMLFPCNRMHRSVNQTEKQSFNID
jgi:hypothetical protein